MSDEDIVRELTNLSDRRLGAYVDFVGEDGQRAADLARPWPHLSMEPIAGGIRIFRSATPIADLTQTFGEQIEPCPYTRAELDGSTETPPGSMWVWRTGHGKMHTAPGAEMHDDVLDWIAKGDLVLSEPE